MEAKDLETEIDCNYTNIVNIQRNSTGAYAVLLYHDGFIKYTGWEFEIMKHSLIFPSDVPLKE